MTRQETTYQILKEMAESLKDSPSAKEFVEIVFRIKEGLDLSDLSTREIGILCAIGIRIPCESHSDCPEGFVCDRGIMKRGGGTFKINIVD